MHACMCVQLFYVVIDPFSVIIIICLNIFSLCICLALNYTFNLNLYSFTCYSDGMFQSKFPFKDNKVLSYLSLGLS